MYPRWHILFGAIFALAFLLIAPETPSFFIVLIFLSSFLIDFDHYAVFFFKTRKLRLKEALEYHKEKEKEEKEEIAKGIRRKSEFHLFHTIEFHALIGLLSIIYFPFFYIFIGMIFHSLLDLLSLIKSGALHRREYFFFNWMKDQIK